MSLEIHPEIPHGGVSKKLNVLFIPSSGIPRIRLLDSRRCLDKSFWCPRTLAPFDTMRRTSTRLRFLPNSRTVSRLLARTAARWSTERTSGNQQVHCE